MITSPTTSQRILLTNAIQRVIAERDRQDAEWGPKHHDYPEWMAILMEEVGEACQHALTMRFHPPADPAAVEQVLDELRTELIHVAAVAIATVEQINESLGMPAHIALSATDPTGDSTDQSAD